MADNVIRMPVKIDIGADRDELCYRMLSEANDIRQHSADRSTKTGAVLLSRDGFKICAVHNGMPPGVADSPERHQRPGKYAFFEHSERRAIYEAAAEGHATKGGMMFASHFPCADCARGIIESRLSRVVVNASLMNVDLLTRFFDSMRDATAMLNESGINVSAFSVIHYEAVASGRNRRALRPLPSGNLLREIQSDIDFYWEDKDPGESTDPIRGALYDATDYMTDYGYIADESATDHKGNIISRWCMGHENGYIRFSSNNRLEWALFGSTCEFGAGSPRDCLEAFSQRRGLEPIHTPGLVAP